MQDVPPFGGWEEVADARICRAIEGANFSSVGDQPWYPRLIRNSSPLQGGGCGLAFRVTQEQRLSLPLMGMTMTVAVMSKAEQLWVG